ncbi:MAG TPA: SGNH/GDSL hydrolase family protein [Candidatus Krumholzibacteria bacterium]
MQKSRKIWLGVLATVVTLAVMLALGEVVINIFSPTEYLYPRYDFSAEYGLLPIAGAVMTHGVPRKYQFHYTVNAQNSRGDIVTPGQSGLPAVVVLGDSYSFGMGVNDGEEYASVMRRALAGKADVANLGVAGWGLTQEIRRYYELGEAYNPRIVILQFCANDPDDNLANRVTLVQDGEFKFVDSDNSLNIVKKYLSRSIVQRTQLYNFFRTRASIVLSKAWVDREASRLEATRPDSARAEYPATEKVYVEMLDLFAKKLHAEGRQLWYISVDHHIDRFPHIAAAIHDLDAGGELRYLETVDWLKGHEPYGSPEGHMWGTVGHRIIGEHLAAEVAAALSDSSAAAAPR